MIARAASAASVFGCFLSAVAVSTWSVRAVGADDSGRRLYEARCSQCHGEEGRGRGTVAPSLIPFKWSYAEALELIRRPMCDMPPIPESDLSDAQVAAIVTYLNTIK